MTKEIYIGGNVASSKNSKRWTGKCLIGSKTTMAYKKNTAKEYALLANTFRTMLKGKTPPYRVEFTFIRDSKRLCDVHNLVQIVADMMVEYGWIEDDNYTIFIPVFTNVIVDKKKAGVIIRVLGN